MKFFMLAAALLTFSFLMLNLSASPAGGQGDLTFSLVGRRSITGSLSLMDTVYAQIPSPPKNPQALTIPQSLYNQAHFFSEKNDLLKAKEYYEKILTDYPDFEGAQPAREELYALNLKIIGSDIPTPQILIHKVRRGESLEKIARKYKTTVDLIKKRNHLESDLIRAGQELSVWRGTFNIVIDKSENILMLESDARVLKVYPVSTGKEETTTPVGEFTIKDRMIDPVWFHRGIVVPPGTPKNFLGTRWLGFNIPKYGIHGTVEPDLIGKSVSGGCVRMRNRDVEELYTLIPEGTKVLIQE